ILAGNLGNAVRSAAGWSPIRMIWEGCREPLTRRHAVRVFLGEGQCSKKLPPDALESIRVEPRLIDRKPQQLDGLVAVLSQRLEAAIKRITAVVEAHAHRDLFHPLLKLERCEIAGSFVHH